VAVVFLAVMLSLTRYPLFATVLENRSADAFLYFLMGAGQNPLIVFVVLSVLIGLLVVLIAWPLLGLIWVWLEGGTLESYHLQERLSWRDFRWICGYWFGSFLALNLLGIVVIVLIAAAGGGLAWAAGLVAPWLS
jgi:hypothetical protein